MGGVSFTNRLPPEEPPWSPLGFFGWGVGVRGASGFVAGCLGGSSASFGFSICLEGASLVSLFEGASIAPPSEPPPEILGRFLGSAILGRLEGGGGGGGGGGGLSPGGLPLGGLSPWR